MCLTCIIHTGQRCVCHGGQRSCNFLSSSLDAIPFLVQGTISLYFKIKTLRLSIFCIYDYIDSGHEVMSLVFERNIPTTQLNMFVFRSNHSQAFSEPLSSTTSPEPPKRSANQRPRPYIIPGVPMPGRSANQRRPYIIAGEPIPNRSANQRRP